MPLFRDIPIRHKLTLNSMVTTLAALAIAGAAFAAYEQITLSKTLVANLATSAQIVGFNSSGALSFNDRAAAEQNLEGLRPQPHIEAACIYDKAGKVFAGYRRDHGNVSGWPQTRRDGEQFNFNQLELFRRIELAGETIGTIYILSDLKEMKAQLLASAYMGAAVTLFALLVAWVTTSRLQRVIAGPISELAAIVDIVSNDKNYSVRAVKAGNDELGRLIDGFNEMLAQIQTREADLYKARDQLEKRVEERTHALQVEIAEREKMSRELLDVSRQAGMAEVATGVLHNVGNVLNSVNVSATVVIDNVHRSKVANLAKISVMMQEHGENLGAYLADDPKGKMIPAYLITLAQNLTGEQKAIAEELDQLRKNIEHIKEIVSMQQSYAMISGVLETVAASELVEDSLRMNAGTLARHAIEVVRDYRSYPTLTIEKNKVLQILINLIRNAKYACDRSGQSDRRIIVRLTENGERVQIAIIDNGVGIPPENLTRIFNHGFTTSKHGHGFGLHSGALVAVELGGSLAVQSDGAGRGATFTLDLPRVPKPNRV